MTNWRSESGRVNIAKRWLRLELQKAVGVRLKQGLENPVNFAERVLWKNRAAEWMDYKDTNTVKAFQAAVVMLIEELKADPEHVFLMGGIAPDELIDRVDTEYTARYGCKRRR